MRFVMVSLTIIFVCLGMSILNQMDEYYFSGSEYDSPRNISIFGWRGAPWITEDNLVYVKDQSAMDGAVGEMSDLKSTPEDFISSSFTTAWTMMVTAFNVIRFFINTLYNTTIGVGPYLNTLGHTSDELFDSTIATIASIGINIIYLLGIGQLYMNRSLKEYA